MNNKSLVYYLGLLTQIGLIIVVNILVAVAIYKAIEWVFTGNIFLLLLLIIIGVISGFYSAYKLIIANGDFDKNG